MERVSAKMFFSVIWGGVCQALEWFFGLFGYKREGKFAKCVWGLFSVSAAIIMAFIACCVINAGYEYIARKHRYAQYLENECGIYVSHKIDYIQDGEGSGYLKNKETGKKVLKDICWIAKPLGKDSLVCFSNGSKRGYFNMKDGKVVIEPRYDHAWIFNNGLAGVVENGMVKFIDETGKVVIDNVMEYAGNADDYVFHGGHLAFMSKETGKYGMIDKTGKTVLPFEYDKITMAVRRKYWHVCKDDKSAVYDNELNVILPFIDGTVFFGIEYIDVTMSDHTMRKYDYSGNLVNDFYISCTNILKYDTGETYYTKDSYVDDYGVEKEYLAEQRKLAVARLRVYETSGYEGLMTPDGHIVTMPLYEEIEAIGLDTYLCTVTDGDKVIVNGKGVIVR